ncbi:MAG: CoA-binding protein [Flavobacteriales bacterium]|nr:CoA-binding protein [Flavobacteriales bacterium]MDW8410013.1 CoA-binding protein [Flavobacteriales bacterium]
MPRHGHSVILMNMRGGEYEGKRVFRFCCEEVKTLPIHTITLYLRPAVQALYYDCLLDLKPQRIIFNPGTENSEFEKLWRQKGVEVVHGCTLVMLRTHQY